MAKRNGKFWQSYEDLALQVVKYEEACDYCLSFLSQHALPITSTRESISDRIVLSEKLLSYYKSIEDYSSCSKLLPFKNGFDIMSINLEEAEMGNYIYNALAVLNYDANREECSEMILEWGLLALNPWIPKKPDDIDYLDVVDRVLEYLKQNRQYEKCDYILQKRCQVENYRLNGKLSKC